MLCVPTTHSFKMLCNIPLWASWVTQLIEESVCNAGDPGSIPGSGSSLGEGIGYPMQYSSASLGLRQ